MSTNSSLTAYRRETPSKNLIFNSRVIMLGLWIVVWFAGTCAVSLAQSSQSARVYLKRGIESYSRGNLKFADKDYPPEMFFDPGGVEPYCSRGRLQIRDCPWNSSRFL